MDSEKTVQVPWRGFHHIAIVTRDLDETIRFYRDMLGMQVGEIMERGTRHCFIKPGDSGSWGLHVFEHPSAEVYPYPDPSERFVFIQGALQHIAFALPDEQSALSLREHLQRRGVEVTGINDLGRVRNFLFLDNNRMLLEATWSQMA